MIASKGEAACALQIDMAKVFVNEAIDRLGVKGKSAITAWATGDMKRTLLMGLRRFTKYEGINVKEARRRVAGAVLEEGRYYF
jgi:hypothetical protein